MIRYALVASYPPRHHTRGNRLDSSRTGKRRFISDASVCEAALPAAAPAVHRLLPLLLRPPAAVAAAAAAAPAAAAAAAAPAAAAAAAAADDDDDVHLLSLCCRCCLCCCCCCRCTCCCPCCCCWCPYRGPSCPCPLLLYHCPIAVTVASAVPLLPRPAIVVFPHRSVSSETETSVDGTQGLYCFSGLHGNQSRLSRLTDHL